MQNSLYSVTHVSVTQSVLLYPTGLFFFLGTIRVVTLTAAMTLIVTGTGIRGLRVDVGLVPMMTKS